MTLTKNGRELADKLNPLIGSTNEIDQLCSRICRLATTHHRLQEHRCNSSSWDEFDEKYDETIERRITALVEELPNTDEGPFTVEFQGDPRGATVKLKINNMDRHPSYDGWASEAIIVPHGDHSG